VAVRRRRREGKVYPIPRPPAGLGIGPRAKGIAPFTGLCGQNRNSNEDKSMQPTWFIRIPFATVFAGHGIGKLIMPVASAEMLALSVPLVLLVGLAELLAGIGAVVGGIGRAPHRALVDRLTGLAAIPVLVGAIALVHWPRWSFVATESHPMGGMEFQVVLLGIALYLLLRRAA
jgi:putative oxidoreductase